MTRLTKLIKDVLAWIFLGLAFGLAVVTAMAAIALPVLLALWLSKLIFG